VNRNQKVYYHRWHRPVGRSPDLRAARPPDWIRASKSARTGDTRLCRVAGRIAQSDLLPGPRRSEYPNLDAPSSVCSTTSTRRTASRNTARASFSRPTRRAAGARDRRDTRPPNRPHGELVPQAPDVIEGPRSFTTHSDTLSPRRLLAAAPVRPGRKPLGEVALPTHGSIVQVTGEPRDTEMFYAFTSFLYPTTIFRHDFVTGTSNSSSRRSPSIHPPRDIQVFYPARTHARPDVSEYKRA